MPADDVDPWSDTTEEVGEVRDDPFGGWPADTAIGEVTGPHSVEGLVARAAHSGARSRRRYLVWLGGVFSLVLVVSIVVIGLLIR